MSFDRITLSMLYNSTPSFNISNGAKKWRSVKSPLQIVVKKIFQLHEIAKKKIVKFKSQARMLFLTISVSNFFNNITPPPPDSSDAIRKLESLQANRQVRKKKEKGQ